MVRVPHACNHNPETTVWAHMNGAIAGKGIGMKGHDLLGMFACSGCHDFIDGRAKSDFLGERRTYAMEGCIRTLCYLLDNDLIEVKVP